MISADFQSKKLFMLLLQVMTIKTDGMEVDTSVRTFVETRDSPASVIFDTRNFKRVNQFVIRDIKLLLDTIKLIIM